EHNRNIEILGELSDFLESDSFVSLLRELGLSYRKAGSFRGLLSDSDEDFFNLSYRAESHEITIKPLLGDESLTFVLDDFEDGAAFVRSQTAAMRELYSRLHSRNSELMQIYSDRELRNSLREYDLTIGTSRFEGNVRVVPVYRIDNSQLITIRPDVLTGEYRMGTESSSSLADLKTALLDFVETGDIRTDSKIQDDLVEEELKALLADEAFLQRLKDLGFTPAGTTREDNDYIYYDLLGPSGVVKGSLALQKDFAEVYLMDADDVSVRSLRTFTSDHRLTFNFQLETAAEPDEMDSFIPAEGSETFLLIGAHEHNADTMILLHADSNSGELRMLSIARDLWYQGQKINAIFRHQGPEQLMSALSNITGLNIRNYIAIDMYAFIDVVNILGGIDVTLDEALVDPTYKVRDNGRWSTLFYPAGTHHLDGIAALRIARSRHTSSDFERAVRQQKVISALKDTVTSLDITDMGKMYEIIHTSGKYVQTNLNTADMFRYFMSYKDYDVTGQNVMNTDNILYATYTNLYRLSEEEQEKALEDPRFFKGGWIVLPKNNDWSIIKSYVRSVLTS
ncbi:MAG: LCP family protein, partial [Spirochaetales bacterium]|nr:LCP family protein [Spirochaetales bacterium]